MNTRAASSRFSFSFGQGEGSFGGAWRAAQHAIPQQRPSAVPQQHAPEARPETPRTPPSAQAIIWGNSPVRLRLRRRPTETSQRVVRLKRNTMSIYNSRPRNGANCTVFSDFLNHSQCGMQCRRGCNLRSSSRASFGGWGRLVLVKSGVRVPMLVLVRAIPALGTDAMKQITNYRGSLERIAQVCEPMLLVSVFRLVWQVVAAVRLFFRPRGVAGFDGSVRTTAGTHSP